jgi:hypothetical protein
MKCIPSSPQLSAFVVVFHNGGDQPIEGEERNGDNKTHTHRAKTAQCCGFLNRHYTHIFEQRKTNDKE